VAHAFAVQLKQLQLEEDQAQLEELDSLYMQ
jgi:hypothetical protein